MSKEAMKLALEALEYWDVHGKLHQPTEEAITSLREALAKPNFWEGYVPEPTVKQSLTVEPAPAQQEPVAWMYVNTDGECEQIEYGEPFDDPSLTPLYTFPQPAPPHECQTEAEKTAFAFGWWKALESVREQPAQQEPVAGQCRFPGVAWSQCDPAHVRMVLDNPHEWKGYEVRYLYDHPPAQRKPLPSRERTRIVRANKMRQDSDEIDPYGVIDDVEAAHGIKENA